MGQQSSHSGNRMQQQIFPTPLWEYSRERCGWLEKQSNEDRQINPCDTFRVVTYNIWFSDKYQPRRFQGLCDILNKSNAQIIALQEMTATILQQLIKQPFIQERYRISDVDGRTFNGWYGVVLLIDIHLHISHLNLVHFPHSSMGRRLILADIKLDANETLRIGTVHLESLNNEQERLRQLSVCQNVFTRSPATCILMGDFNFNAHGRENIDKFKALPGWIDVWENLMGPEHPGYTFDTETNTMTKANADVVDRSRIDRIILQSQTVLPTDIKILGTNSIGTHEHLSIYPSDHYGLTAVFQKRK